MPAAVQTQVPQPTAAHEIEGSPCTSAQPVDSAATQLLCGLLCKASAVSKVSSTFKLQDCTCGTWWHLAPGMIQEESLHTGLPLQTCHACHICCLQHLAVAEQWQHHFFTFAA